MEFFDINKVYENYISQGGEKSLLVEKYINHIDIKFYKSEDLLQNLFGGNHIKLLFNEALRIISKENFENSIDAINCLKFIQDIGSMAMWKYNIKVDNDLEDFIRDFDRLDVEFERKRLYLKIHVV